MTKWTVIRPGLSTMPLDPEIRAQMPVLKDKSRNVADDLKEKLVKFKRIIVSQIVSTFRDMDKEP